ncbi:MAG: Gfo/Idh/MocA family oxidoreductase [Verrucomicrobiota bacterium]
MNTSNDHSMKRNGITRRTFLKRAALAGAAGLPSFVPRHVLGFSDKPGANDQIRLGLIGAGGRGAAVAREAANAGARIAAVCDVDQNHLARAAKTFEKADQSFKVATFVDYRRLMESKELDAVIIAAPDHWHALMTVHACQAGKDVYCEKPACNTIAEGQAMVRAALLHQRIVQIGSQGRSHPDAQAAREYIRSGKLGKVTKVTCWHPSNREGGFEPSTEPPAHLDWDKWLGPAKWRPYNAAIHPFGFRWLIDLGGGNIRDRGAHIFSVASFLMDADAQGPVSVEATGEPPKRGLYDCPTTMRVVYEFKKPGWTLVWEQPGERPQTSGKKDYGSKYWGDKNTLWVEGGDGGVLTEEKARKAAGLSDERINATKPHMENFLACLRSREKPAMSVEKGVKVANLCILGNLSYLLKRKLNWDPAKEKFLLDDEANKLLSNPGRGEWRLGA